MVSNSFIFSYLFLFKMNDQLRLSLIIQKYTRFKISSRGMFLEESNDMSSRLLRSETFYNIRPTIYLWLGTRPKLFYLLQQSWDDFSYQVYPNPPSLDTLCFEMFSAVAKRALLNFL